MLTSGPQKTYLETVLRVALTESEDKKPILVYASAKALDEEALPLPQALQVEIKALPFFQDYLADNSEAFRQVRQQAFQAGVD